MAQVDWYIEGVEVSNCNCDYACPCQFESPRPTHGDCRGFAAVRIDKGHFGDVALDGLVAALLYGWPGPIYEGNGECQAVIDELDAGSPSHTAGPNLDRVAGGANSDQLLTSDQVENNAANCQDCSDTDTHRGQAFTTDLESTHYQENGQEQEERVGAGVQAAGGYLIERHADKVVASSGALVEAYPMTRQYDAPYRSPR